MHIHFFCRLSKPKAQEAVANKHGYQNYQHMLPIAVGYGSKCSSILVMTRAHTKSVKASKVQRSLFDGFRYDYTYAIFEGYLVIIDLNLGGTSVTNNAEGVLKEIWSEGISPSNVLGVIYTDTDGYYDELKISPEGRFRGFKAWHKLSAMEIIEEAAN